MMKHQEQDLKIARLVPKVYENTQLIVDINFRKYKLIGRQMLSNGYVVANELNSH